MNVIEVFQDCKDRVGENENGFFSIPKYNRFSRLAELRLIDWITGDISGLTPPEPYLTQKNKDWLSPFIKKYTAHAVNGSIDRPADYYKWDNFYRLGSKISSDCEEDETAIDSCNTPIEILDGAKFNKRCISWIEGERPSLVKPISKLVGKNFEVAPADLGSVGLEYIRYPIFGSVAKKKDLLYNRDVPDPDNSIDYEWEENAREVLVYFIVDQFSNTTREQALKQFNNATGKTVRG